MEGLGKLNEWVMKRKSKVLHWDRLSQSPMHDSFHACSCDIVYVLDLQPNKLSVHVLNNGTSPVELLVSGERHGHGTVTMHWHPSTIRGFGPSHS